MEQQDRNQSLVPPIADRWKTVLQVRGEFASELDQMAGELPGGASKHLRSLSRWFKGPAPLEEALRRPDVLAISLPLIKSSAEAPISTSEITRAARLGFCSMGQNFSVSRHFLRLIAYPLLVLLVAALLGIGFSFWIAPQFEEMFAEFGIELPSMTKGVLALARLVRRAWWVLFAFPLGAALIVWILNRIAGGPGSNQSSWVDQQLMSTRDALASWAWHISLLLEAGLSQSEAVKNAGFGTAKAWLRQCSVRWAENEEQGQSNDQSFFVNPKYQLLNRAMQLPPSSAKITVLREVAAYYWDRNRTIGDWWVQWLVALILCIIAVAILFAILSLFMPLIAIVSGLTSSK